MLTFLSAGFFVLGFALAYFIWIKPLLRARPAFADFYARSDSFWKAAWAKFSTLKTKLAAIFLAVASALIELHDFLLPAVTGVDWTPVTTAVPPVVWPFVSFGIAALFYWLRTVTAKTQEQVVAAVERGMAPAEAAMMIPGEGGGEKL